MKLKFAKVKAEALREGDLFFNTTMSPDQFKEMVENQVGVTVFLRGAPKLNLDVSKLAPLWRVTITKSRQKKSAPDTKIPTEPVIS
jgi:hypothetical protein